MKKDKKYHSITTSKDLAVQLADIARDIREKVKVLLKPEQLDVPLHDNFKHLRDNLIPELSIENFADMYAQTITYMLFTGRLIYNTDFKIEHLLKSIFTDMDNSNFDKLGINSLFSLLKSINLDLIFK